MAEDEPVVWVENGRFLTLPVRTPEFKEAHAGAFRDFQESESGGHSLSRSDAVKLRDQMDWWLSDNRPLLPHDETLLGQLRQALAENPGRRTDAWYDPNK